MDPILTTILVKGVDFLFDEGRKILQWRREHLAPTTEPAAERPATPVAPPTDTSGSAKPVVSAKDDLLRQRIDEAMLANKQSEIQHLVALMEIHTRNFRTAEQQYAKWGDALAPPIILNNLKSEGDAVEATMRRLRAAVSEVYATDVVIPELDGN